MINKRLLVKALLSHNDENSFYDKKLKLNLASKAEKAKFLKHICALSNANPHNNSFIVIGIEDQSNSIVGVDFFDDSKIQNLINAYLKHPPLVLYENIPFPHLPQGKVVGLVTIRPMAKITSFLKNISKYPQGMVFTREGSTSKPHVFDQPPKDNNSQKVATIERHAKNNIRLTLEGVIDFREQHQGELSADYRVFKETFVVCWAGLKKTVNDKTYYSRVDIELINEQVKLFYSHCDEVDIVATDNAFILTEYIRLDLNQQPKYYPLEEVKISFADNGSYSIHSRLLFSPPEMDKGTLHHLYNAAKALLQKMALQHPLTPAEKRDLSNLCPLLMLSVLHGIQGALEQMDLAKPLLKHYSTAAYQSYKDAQRVLRKVKYN